jgi:hypothetical protein
VAVAELVTFPVQAFVPSQTIAAPTVEAADGPAGSRAAFTRWVCPAAGSPAKARAAPGPVEALDTERTSPQEPVQVAVLSALRGVPFATAPSQAVVEVRTVPEQFAVLQFSVALELEVEDGPDRGCPAKGLPVTGSVSTKSGALDAEELLCAAPAPPVTAKSAVAEVPRACGVTAVSRALVDVLVVPPHSPRPPPHSADAVVCDTLTGPDTGTTPPACRVRRPVAGLRSLTVVSVLAVQSPPAPRELQNEEAVLSRSPITSPDAAPDVVLDPDPAHCAVLHSTVAPAVLDAVSSRIGSTCPAAAAARRAARDGVAVTSSPTCEAASIEQLPSQFDAALVSRTGAAAPAVAGTPVTFPLVDPAALPQPAVPPQSTPAEAVLEADASPSTSAACRTVPAGPLVRPARCCSTALRVSVLLWASPFPPVTSKEVWLALSRTAPARIPVALPAVAVPPRPEQAGVSQSTSASARTTPERSRSTDVALSQSPVHSAVLLPRRCSSPVGAPLVEPAGSASGRSVFEPELSLRHEPLPESHAAAAPFGVAMLC